MSVIERWENGPGAIYPIHDHPYHKRLTVERGSITFRMAGKDVLLNASDTLEIPPGTSHSAVVGSTGVVCVETHLQ